MKRTEIGKNSPLFAKVFELSPMGVALLNTEFYFLKANDAFCNMMGYDESELMQFTFKEITHPDHIQNDLAAIRRLIDGQIPVYQTEKRYIRKDQKILWGAIRISVIPDADGKFEFLLAMVEDITERKHFETMLLESEEKFRTIFEKSMDAILFTSPDGKIYSANARACELFEMTETEICEVGRAGVIDSTDSKLAKAIEEREKTGSFYGELTFLKKDGTKFPAEVSSMIFPDLNGERRTSMIIRDITKRKEAEEKLRKSEQEYRTLFEGANDAIFIMDQETFIDCNPTTLNMFGCEKKEEIINHVPWEFSPAIQPDGSDSKEKAFIYINAALKGVPQRFQWQHIKKDGTPFDAEISLSRIMLGKDQCLTSMVRDITKRKKAEQAMKESEVQMREMNATKDKFFAIIAHDLKSPFNSILGFSNLLAERMQEKDYDGIEKFVKIIQNSSQRSMELILNLLEWSRSQTGRIEFNPEYIEIVSLINEVIQLSEDAAQQKLITISRELPHHAPVFADKGMINTILRNLINNAIKFTNSGGRIIISAVQNQKELQVSVSDNGVGIEKEAIEKIFRIDESYSRSGTNNEKGSGLGLILCKEFVVKHNGSIWIESELGQGSTIRFTIPVKQDIFKFQNSVKTMDSI